jgi:hypothetical protein
MAMPAAGGEPPRAQKLRIMFKGTKLVEVTRPMQDPNIGEHHTASRFQCKLAMAAGLLQHWTLPRVSFEGTVHSKHCRALCGRRSWAAAALQLPRDSYLAQTIYVHAGDGRDLVC